MTIKQISATQRRLIEQYKSCITTRNAVIDMFEREFNRHVKLIFGNIVNKNAIETVKDKYRPSKDEQSTTTSNEAVKEIINGYPVNHELRISLKDSLKKSRNMKKIQIEMNDVKARLKETQAECRKNKRLYIATQSALSDKGIKDTEEYKRSIRMIDKFETRNEQRANH